MASRDGARQQQVGDVGAGDEEHETDDDEDRHQWLLIPAAERRETGRGGNEGEAGPRGIATGPGHSISRRRGRQPNLRLEAPQHRGRLLDGLAGLHPGHDVQPPGRSAVEKALRAAEQRFRADRNGDIVGAADIWPEESPLRDADNREGNTADRQAAADYVSRASESALPEAIADDRHRAIRSASARIVAGVSVRPSTVETPSTSNIRPLAQMPLTRSVVPPFERSKESAAQAKAPSASSSFVRANLLPDRVGPFVAADQRELLRVAHGERLEDQAVEDREERRIGADAEREREDGNRGDERRRTKRTPGVAPVDGEPLSHRHVSKRLGMIDARRAIEAGGQAEPECGDDSRHPEAEKRTHAVRAGVVEFVAEGVRHARGEPRADSRRVGRAGAGRRAAR